MTITVTKLLAHPSYGHPDDSLVVVKIVAHASYDTHTPVTPTSASKRRAWVHVQILNGAS